MMLPSSSTAGKYSMLSIRLSFLFVCKGQNKK